MAKFSVVIHTKAEAEFRAIPFPHRRQLNQLIFKLMDDPHPPGSKVLEEERCHITAHGWLIAYEVDDVKRVITIIGFAKSTDPAV